MIERLTWHCVIPGFLVRMSAFNVLKHKRSMRAFRSPRCVFLHCRVAVYCFNVSTPMSLVYLILQLEALQDELEAARQEAARLKVSDSEQWCMRLPLPPLLPASMSHFVSFWLRFSFCRLRWRLSCYNLQIQIHEVCDGAFLRLTGLPDT